VLLRNQNGYFNYPPKVGYKFNFHNTWIDKHFSGTTSVENALTGLTQTFTGNTPSYSGITFTGGTQLPIGTSGLTGAFVEYNESELTERIVSESYHKFTHRRFLNGTNPLFEHQQSTSPLIDEETDDVLFTGQDIHNPYGYFYQPHHRIKLRELSPYVESYKTNEVYGLPENARYFPDEKLWKWRDLYDNGFLDADGYGTNYPFINGIHYIKKDINFYLRNEVTFKNKEDGVIKFTNLSFDC
jgi:hypothetical protein